jgi:hypothetical protein
MTKTREWPVRAMKYKNRWLMVPFVLLLISALFFSGIIVSADPATAVTIQPASQKVGIGDTFTMNISVSPDTAIAGAQCSLSFNASVLKANIVTEGNLLTQGGASTYFAAGTINNVAGTITNVVGVITTNASVSSPGTFATVSFNATAAGNSTLHLSNVIVGNQGGGAVGTTLTDGSVTVCPDWDVNLDLLVNVNDMILVGNHWGESNVAAPHWIREDVNRDGYINVLDMILIGQHWTG